MSEHTPGPCRKCGREYEPEPFDLGICCICFRDIAFARVFGGEWRALIAAAPELLEELDRLTGEVRGCWGMAEQALREILGNTNYHIVEERLESSRIAVAKALGRKP